MGTAIATRRRRGLPSPLERDLDRVRLSGLERVSAVAAAGLEVLPELASVVAAADRIGAGVDAAEGSALRAMAIRAVVSQALEDLGDEPAPRAGRSAPTPARARHAPCSPAPADGASARRRPRRSWAAPRTHIGAACAPR